MADQLPPGIGLAVAGFLGPPAPPKDKVAAADAERAPVDVPAAPTAVAEVDGGGLQDVEEKLQAKASQGNEMVLQLVQSLGEAMVYPDPGNFRTNRKLWDLYAKDWSEDSAWVVGMAQGSHSGDGEACATSSSRSAEGGGGDGDAKVGGTCEPLKFVGDEWSTAQDLLTVVADFIAPNVHAGSVAAEIGSGGGRVAIQVAPLVSELRCFDISEAMLAKAKHALREHANVSFTLLDEPRFSPEFDSVYDFLYVFDVFVHFDLHTMWRYFEEMHRMLKPEGVAFISTANLLTPGGWTRFSRQSKFTVGGFYFVSPEIVRSLIEKAGFRIIKEANVDPSNTYYNRDYLALITKAK